MSDGLFGQILGGSLGYSSDPRAVQNADPDTRARWDLMRTADSLTAEQRLRYAEAVQNAVPRYYGPPERPARIGILAHLSRWFFQG